MNIKRIKINGFGKLEKKEIQFDKRINVIYGNNEAGKSTLLKFMSSCLYGISKNKNGEIISDYEKYKPWHNYDYSGKIEYQMDDSHIYEVYRDFNKKNPIIYDENGEDLNSTAKFEVNGQEKTVTGRLTVADDVQITSQNVGTQDVYTIKELVPPDNYCKFDGIITVRVTKSVSNGKYIASNVQYTVT